MLVKIFKKLKLLFKYWYCINKQNALMIQYPQYINLKNVETLGRFKRCYRRIKNL